jgi:hypothetical protein
MRFELNTFNRNVPDEELLRHESGLLWFERRAPYTLTERRQLPFEFSERPQASQGRLEQG